MSKEVKIILKSHIPEDEIEALIKTYYPNALVIHKKDLQGKNRMTFAIEGDFDEVK